MGNFQIKRIKLIGVTFTAIAFLLACRLFYIQVICHEELAEAAVSQYEVVIEGIDTRGQILDRNGKALTDVKYQYYYVIKKSNIEKYNTENSLQINEELMGTLNATQIAKTSSSYLVYTTEEFDDDIAEELKTKYNGYIFKAWTRYSQTQSACHLIGYLNEDEKTGVSGMELLYENILETSGSKLSIWADASGNIIQGLAPNSTNRGSVSSNSQNNTITTTIDRRIQRISENALAAATTSGAVVVMDSDTGEIISWASSPTFDPSNIEEYLYQNGDCLINKVSQVSYAPGSVFKIVTAAAALEGGFCTINQEFECKGQATVYGITLGCATAQEGGHGVINMKDAMAYSCNCYFAKLGELVGVEAILEMAEKLGLGEKTLLNFPEESAGNIPDETEVGLWDTSNISIGQGEILTTPLQIAVMTSIIANGGKIIKPQILLEENTYSNQVLSQETASSISEMLGAVMIYGTGKSTWSTDIYGKTGTAETSTDEKNCWFTGYYALGEKTYVITIMAEDGVSGTTTCLPVFKKIAKALEALY